MSNSTENSNALGAPIAETAVPKSGAAKVDTSARVERQFQARPGSSAKIALGLGLAGSAALGAGVFGFWFAPSVVPGAAALLGGGALALMVTAWLGSREVPPVRVGELGVIFGEAAESPRVAWCDVRGVRVVGDTLRLETSGAAIEIPLEAHAPAAARILAEAALRIGDRVDVSPKAHERLPALVDDDAVIVPAARLQLAGRRCASSGKSITFESDARVCPNCAALYHVSHVPVECTSCGKPLERSS